MRVVEVEIQRGVVENGHIADVDVVVATLSEATVCDERLACYGIDGWRAGDRINDRCLKIFELDFVSGEGVTRVFQAARGYETVLGCEVGIVELSQNRS